MFPPSTCSDEEYKMQIRKEIAFIRSNRISDDSFEEESSDDEIKPH